MNSFLNFREDWCFTHLENYTLVFQIPAEKVFERCFGGPNTSSSKPGGMSSNGNSLSKSVVSVCISTGFLVRCESPERKQFWHGWKGNNGCSVILYKAGPYQL